ncbi:MAG: permease prefix domain 1-containing protein [Oscillospiraceae bacterium]|jgi:hypothetical protein|nr:permease prefix domain 1-containing protein [Oscillospiraceae bacterium]
MKDRIKTHVEGLFQDAPHTRRVREAREELLAGCLDKYEDLTAHGRSPEEAYEDVISGIGDVTELLRAIGELDAADPISWERQRQKRALFVSFGVFLYVLALGATALAVGYVSAQLGGVIFFILIALGTMLVVYGMVSTRTERYTTFSRSGEERTTMSQEITAQMVSGSRNKQLEKAVSALLWPLATLCFLCVGFLFHAWHPGWLIFPACTVAQLLVNLAFAKPGHRRGLAVGILWTASAPVYLILSFATGRWDITWVLFPLALCVQQALYLRRVWRNSDEK